MAAEKLKLINGHTEIISNTKRLKLMNQILAQFWQEFYMYKLFDFKFLNIIDLACLQAVIELLFWCLNILALFCHFFPLNKS